MLKLRLVALATLAAIVGLVFSLSALNRHRTRHDAAPAVSQAEQVQAAPAASIQEPAPQAEAPTTMAPISADGFRDYAVLPDGRPVPPLPPTAPKSCGFGAILFTYDGVQLAPRNPRTKAEALSVATRLIADAERDFADAVRKGDPGSLADAGNVGRGILERSIEYQLFTLEKGKVYPEPIETPRGYWILRRLR